LGNQEQSPGQNSAHGLPIRIPFVSRSRTHCAQTIANTKHSVDAKSKNYSTPGQGGFPFPRHGGGGDQHPAKAIGKASENFRPWLMARDLESMACKTG
jgi:hypothetical protein